MKIAITGSSGFIGRQLSRRLAAAGHELFLFDLRPLCPELEGRAHTILGNLATGAGLAAIPWRDLDIVMHLAAAGVKASRRFWPECLQVNVLGTRRLLDQLEGCDTPPRLITTRTFYENHMGTACIESNPYVATKKAASDLISIYRARNRLPADSLTIFQAYGPNDDSSNVLTYVAHQLQLGQVARLGSGLGLRDWIHVEDLVGALIGLVHAEPGDYDAGSGEVHSIRFMAEMIADLMQKPRSLLEFDAGRDRGEEHIQDHAKRRVGNWTPSLSLVQGLQSLIGHCGHKMQMPEILP